MEPEPVQILMDADDFERLCNNGTAWAGYAEDHEYGGKTHPGWRTQISEGRFEVSGKAGFWPSLRWKQAYWVGPDYTAVILARSFLTAWSFECSVVWDLAEPGEWVILTDYERKEG
jgi:hypothetical protein